MSEQQEVQGHLTITAFFGRKVNDGNYGAKEASIFIQRDVPLGADAETITETAQGAFTLAKCMVLDELSLEYTIDEARNVVIETAPVVEAPVKAAPKSRAKAAAAPVATSEAEAALEAAFGSVSEDTGEGAEVIDMATRQPVTSSQSDVIPLDDKGKPAKWWLENRFKTHPDEFYDNREAKASGKYKKTAPDVKHKASGQGVWLKSG